MLNAGNLALYRWGLCLESSMIPSQKKRLGRGTGSGLGKTSGRGHKGQKARAGKADQMIVLSRFFQVTFSLASFVGSPE
jgi:hypothetical protein